ncbi:MAG: flavodoxin domain-containing protein [Methanomassiliicoccales archaeon]|jgi:menaquinone-dependent protoporphyrinogen oxidase
MRVLVAFGTKYGSTEKVATEIASLLQRLGHDAEVVDLRDRIYVELEDYDMVVIGSGIVYGSWSKESLRFLNRNSKKLNKSKLAMFACCGDLMLDPSRVEEYRQKYLQDVADRYGLHPIDIGLFGGVLDFSKYGLQMNDILKVPNSSRRDLEGKDIDPTVLYDLRDWSAIRRWVIDLEGVR